MKLSLIALSVVLACAGCHQKAPTAPRRSTLTIAASCPTEVVYSITGVWTGGDVVEASGKFFCEKQDLKFYIAGVEYLSPVEGQRDQEYTIFFKCVSPKE